MIQLKYPDDGALVEIKMADPVPAEQVANVKWDALKKMREDRSVPSPTRFAWHSAARPAESMRYEFLLSRASDFRASLCIGDLEEEYVEVYNLHLDTTYFWKVRVREGVLLVAESDARSFRTHAEPPRWIRVPGISNVRDLGGWRVAGGRRIVQGMVYRSSELNAHFEIQPEGKRVLTEDLGLKSVIDLRGENEPCVPVLDPAKVRYFNIPIKPYDNIANEAGMREYRDVFRLFADAQNYPVLFHCWGGCDRGGTVAFLLKALLGLDREFLIRDYELSSLSIWGDRSHKSENFQSLLAALSTYGKPGDSLAAQVEAYLLGIGVTSSEIDTIRSLLLENGEGI